MKRRKWLAYLAMASAGINGVMAPRHGAAKRNAKKLKSISENGSGVSKIGVAASKTEAAYIS
jgi:hypothetical protein